MAVGGGPKLLAFTCNRGGPVTFSHYRRLSHERAASMPRPTDAEINDLQLIVPLRFSESVKGTPRLSDSSTFPNRNGLGSAVTTRRELLWRENGSRMRACRRTGRIEDSARHSSRARTRCLPLYRFSVYTDDNVSAELPSIISVIINDDFIPRHAKHRSGSRLMLFHKYELRYGDA